MDVTLRMIGAEWCGTCKRMWPWMREIADQLPGHVTYSYVNIGDCTDPHVLSVPTLLVLRDGTEVGRTTRFSGKRALLRDIRGMLEAPQ